MFNSMRSVAESILRENDRGLYTIPSARLYPHQWAWDSAFAAVGWAHLDLERACVELETLLGGQWEDGRVPHILFHQDTPDYFPGPGAWGAGGSSSITAWRNVGPTRWNSKSFAVKPIAAANGPFTHVKVTPLNNPFLTPSV